MYNQSDKGGSKKWQGFSIVELLIVLAIIGIISSIIIPQVGGVLPNSKEVLAREFVEKLNRALKNPRQNSLSRNLALFLSLDKLCYVGAEAT